MKGASECIFVHVCVCLFLCVCFCFVFVVDFVNLVTIAFCEAVPKEVILKVIGSYVKGCSSIEKELFFLCLFAFQELNFLFSVMPSRLPSSFPNYHDRSLFFNDFLFVSFYVYLHMILWARVVTVVWLRPRSASKVHMLQEWLLS